MELRTLTTFLKVASLNSFSKAAAELDYTQAAVTIQIQQLEKELSAQLFERFGKKITLTYQGKLLQQYANQILQLSEEAKQALQTSQTLCGHVRIGTIESLCTSIFPSLLCQYHKQYPEVSISIETSSPGLLLKEMNSNQLDIVYLLDKKLYHPDWIKAIEEPEDIVFVASSSHPLVKKKSLQIDDILSYDIILTEKAASYRYELEQYLHSKNKKIQPYLEIANTQFILQMLMDGEGISLLPRYCIEKNTCRNLTILKPRGFHLQVWHQILYHKNKWVTPEIEAFLAIVKENRKRQGLCEID